MPFYGIWNLLGNFVPLGKESRALFRNHVQPLFIGVSYLGHTHIYIKTYVMKNKIDNGVTAVTSGTLVELLFRRRVFVYTSAVPNGNISRHGAATSFLVSFFLYIKTNAPEI